jgi:hypothetical protein
MFRLGELSSFCFKCFFFAAFIPPFQPSAVAEELKAPSLPLLFVLQERPLDSADIASR